jgi:hypothetical protein
MVLGRFPFDVGDKIRIGVEYIPGSDQKERMMKSSGREIPGKEHKIWILSKAVCGIAA